MPAETLKNTRVPTPGGEPARRRGRIAAAMALAAAIAPGLSLGVGEAAAQTKLAIGSTASASSDYVYFVAFSRLINAKVKGVESNVIETGATLDNLRRISNNQIDLALVTTNMLNQAYAGKGTFEGKPVKARILWVYGLSPQNVIVREDSGIKTIAELVGKRFNPGLRGSGTEKTAEAVFKVLGIAPDYVRGSTGEMVANIKDNRVLGYVKGGAAMRLDASAMDIASTTKIRVLSLTDSEKTKVRSSFSELSVIDVPDNMTPGVPAYSTWGFGSAVVARPDLPDELGYQITKAVNENLEAQYASLPDLKRMNFVELTLKYSSSPLHPGAARYYKEIGKQLPPTLLQ